MKRALPVRLSDLRGIHRLASDATVGITDLVESMHHTIQRTPGPLGTAPGGRTRGITGFVYRTVRGVTRLIGGGVDELLGRLGALIDDEHSSPAREAALAALNGVLGDYLAASGNPLAIPMGLRAAGAPLPLAKAALTAAFPQPSTHVVVLVHGLCMNPLQWMRNGHDHGAALARDTGCTPLYLHYNTGRHISENGRDFAAVVDALWREWPHPIEQLTLIGHSMGGLVARSACHYASVAGQPWIGRLAHLVCLGTPHLGAPLERAGKWADYLIGISPYSAPFARLGKVRSAGVQDLGHGYLRDEDWSAAAGRHRGAVPAAVALPSGAVCCAIAASRHDRPRSATTKPRGDGWVPVESALGRHKDPARDVGFLPGHQWIGYGMGHFDLLDDTEAYARIRRWLG